MHTRLLCLAVVFIAPQLPAAPAPAPGRQAKEKLEALKKRLPDLVEDWLKKRPRDNWITRQWTCKPELRLVRQVGPERAKVVIFFAMFDDTGAPVPSQDVLLTIFLSYYDGFWTTERSEVAGHLNEKNAVRPTFSSLMLALDEATEKKP